MSYKTDPKNAVENWKIEVTVDEKATLNLLTASVRSPIGLKNLLAIFGKALENGRKHLERNDFVADNPLP